MNAKGSDSRKSHLTLHTPRIDTYSANIRDTSWLSVGIRKKMYLFIFFIAIAVIRLFGNIIQNKTGSVYRLYNFQYITCVWYMDGTHENSLKLVFNTNSLRTDRLIRNVGLGKSVNHGIHSLFATDSTLADIVFYLHKTIQKSELQTVGPKQSRFSVT